MAARVLAAAQAPLGHIAPALDRFSPDIDLALWALVGRTPQQALAVLNGHAADQPDEHPLRRRVLMALGLGAATAAQLAEILDEDPDEVMAALRNAAAVDLVDAHEPPPPCGSEALRWFQRVQRRELQA